MRLQVVSDLHLEFYKEPSYIDVVPAPDADALVIAGDIGHGTSVIDRFKQWPVPVIYIHGDHEVVVTHHAPHWESVAERYRKDMASAGFASHLEPLMAGTDI